MGGVLGFAIAFAVLVTRSSANRARIARGESPLRNQSRPSLSLPFALIGAIVGVVAAVA